MAPSEGEIPVVKANVVKDGRVVAWYERHQAAAENQFTRGKYRRWKWKRFFAELGYIIVFDYKERASELPIKFSYYRGLSYFESAKEKGYMFGSTNYFANLQSVASESLSLELFKGGDEEKKNLQARNILMKFKHHIQLFKQLDPKIQLLPMNCHSFSLTSFHYYSLMLLRLKLIALLAEHIVKLIIDNLNQNTEVKGGRKRCILSSLSNYQKAFSFINPILSSVNEVALFNSPEILKQLVTKLRGIDRTILLRPEKIHNQLLSKLTLAADLPKTLHSLLGLENPAKPTTRFRKQTLTLEGGPSHHKGEPLKTYYFHYLSSIVKPFIREVILSGLDKAVCYDTSQTILSTVNPRTPHPIWGRVHHHDEANIPNPEAIDENRNDEVVMLDRKIQISRMSGRYSEHFFKVQFDDIDEDKVAEDHVLVDRLSMIQYSIFQPKGTSILYLNENVPAFDPEQDEYSWRQEAFPQPYKKIIRMEFSTHQKTEEGDLYGMDVRASSLRGCPAMKNVKIVACAGDKSSSELMMFGTDPRSNPVLGAFGINSTTLVEPKFEIKESATIAEPAPEAANEIPMAPEGFVLKNRLKIKPSSKISNLFARANNISSLIFNKTTCLVNLSLTKVHHSAIQTNLVFAFELERRDPFTMKTSRAIPFSHPRLTTSRPISHIKLQSLKSQLYAIAVVDKLYTGKEGLKAMVFAANRTNLAFLFSKRLTVPVAALKKVGLKLSELRVLSQRAITSKYTDDLIVWTLISPCETPNELLIFMNRLRLQ